MAGCTRLDRVIRCVTCNAIFVVYNNNYYAYYMYTVLYHLMHIAFNRGGIIDSLSCPVGNSVTTKLKKLVLSPHIVHTCIHMYMYMYTHMYTFTNSLMYIIYSLSHLFTHCLCHSLQAEKVLGSVDLHDCTGVSQASFKKGYGLIVQVRTHSYMFTCFNER